MGKFTISMVIFHSYVSLPEGKLAAILSIPHLQTRQELVAGEGKGFWAGVSDAAKAGPSTAYYA